MPKITHLVLSLESKPGVLAKVVRTLADAGVNIDALSAPETTGRGKIRIAVSDVERGKEALRRAKYRPTEEAALSVTLENRPGALAAEKLAGAKVNIKSIYATTAGAGTATVVMTVSNVDKAQSAIG
ncbi:MAG: ACT domain-containing protein [Candidatus Rokubacteria bacterium]|nr:ACT domain-containing protein [Candidatus Rokubacteria bacterium]